jgi:hypothetical protein
LIIIYFFSFFILLQIVFTTISAHSSTVFIEKSFYRALTDKLQIAWLTTPLNAPIADYNANVSSFH